MEQMMLGIDVPVDPAKSDKNPMVNKHGFGPEDKTCATCAQFMELEYHNRAYFKCMIRGVTHGSATDHRKRFNACGLYEEE